MTEAATQDSSPVPEAPELTERPAEDQTEATTPREPAVPRYRYSVRPGPATFVVVEETTGLLVTAQPLLSEHEAQQLADRWNRRQQQPA